MNCSRFETILSDFTANRLEKPVMAAAQEHLEHCPSCRELLEEVAQLRQQLGDFPVAAAPAELVERILERTTGKPEPRSLWRGLILPTIQPFLTQRYAFATVMLFVFLSLMVNIVGPPAGAVLSPSRLAESADRFTSRITRGWAEAVDFQARVVQEVKLLSEDLWSRLDYHLISTLLTSVDTTVQQQEAGQPDAAGQSGDVGREEEESPEASPEDGR